MNGKRMRHGRVGKTEKPMRMRNLASFIVVFIFPSSSKYSASPVIIFETYFTCPRRILRARAHTHTATSVRMTCITAERPLGVDAGVRGGARGRGARIRADNPRVGGGAHANPGVFSLEFSHLALRLGVFVCAGRRTPTPRSNAPSPAPRAHRRTRAPSHRQPGLTDRRVAAAWPRRCVGAVGATWKIRRRGQRRWQRRWQRRG
jgi:hypothetical protein